MFGRSQFDAIVVGSGATGGWAAKTLAEAGMSVLVLEAGRSHRWMQGRYFYEQVRRKLGYLAENDRAATERQKIQSQCYAWRYHPTAFVSDTDQPYAVSPERPFVWIRTQHEGGRLSAPVHGLQFYRFSDQNLKAASCDGFGTDWPIAYSDLAPYYDRVERFIGLTGNADNIAHLPNPIPGPHTPITAAEQYFNSKIAERWPDRAVIRRRTASQPLPIRAARATGKVTVRLGAIAREIGVDPDTGLANRISWLENGKEREAKARVVVLAASAIESTRLLLNSRGPRHPNGLGNSSGVLGLYLMDHLHVSVFQATMKLPPSSISPDFTYAYIPQFRNVSERRPDFIRGYGVHFFTERDQCYLTAFGEMLPRPENRIAIDPALKDKWGIPCVRIDCRHSDNERAIVKDVTAECQAMLAQAGFDLAKGEPSVGVPGLSIHECGTARMGNDPRTSVLNKYNQSWDVKNLFVVDGSCFVSQGVQNPTLTMMAIALRASEHIIDLCRRCEL